MDTEKNKNINYVRIMGLLRQLRDTTVITEKEYKKAKKYYQKLTGANLVLAD